MSLDEKFAPVRTMVYQMVGNFFQIIAGFFGYPQNPGMPIMPDLENEIYARYQFLNSLPRHTIDWPQTQRPETWFEMIFGPVPKVESVSRYSYTNNQEGFYNFYIENYKNLYFLPDSVSEFLQVKLNLCLDITLLESLREVLFVGLVVYTQIITLRISLAWLLYLNPYTVPWCYLCATVDWTEELLVGMFPSILGINFTSTIVLGILGNLADSLNHLVFTMPFLPSEGEPSKLLINQQVKDVIIFHYLPILWYRYPIPNEIRKFWYNERPDILKYMLETYPNLDLQCLPDEIIHDPFLPEEIIQELTRQKIGQIISETTIGESLSTELLSNTLLSNLNNSSMDFTLITDHFSFLVLPNF